MRSLRQTDVAIRHELSFALSFVDHFTRQPIEQELPVTAGGVAPVRSRAGKYRQADGTYRFIDLQPGDYPLAFQVPDGRWRTLAGPPVVTVPLTERREALRVELWPTTRSETRSGSSAIRGRLVGSTVADLTVEMSVGAAEFDRFTRSESDGSFLYFLTERAAPDIATGRVVVRVRVQGGARLVTGISVLGLPAPLEFPSSSFETLPGREVRADIQV